MNLIKKLNRACAILFALMLLLGSASTLRADEVRVKDFKEVLSKKKLYDRAALEKMGLRFGNVKAQSQQYYKVTVINGIRSGTYRDQSRIYILANPTPPGKTYDAWYINGVRSEETSNLIESMIFGFDLTFEMRYRDEEPADAHITVNQGLGTGTYGPGVVMAGIFDAPPANQFIEGAIGAPIFTSTFGVDADGKDVTITPVYKPLSSGQEFVTLTNATQGSRWARHFDTLLVIAKDIPNKEFERWNTNCSANFQQSPIMDIGVVGTCQATANYRDTGPVVQFTITVTSGTADGATSKLVTPGQTVNLVANDPSPGFLFDKWVGAPVQDPASPATLYTMPANDVTVVATYKAQPVHQFYFTQALYTFSEAATLPPPSFMIDGQTGFAGNTTVKWKITGGSAVQGVDYTNATEGTLQWLDGQQFIRPVFLNFVNDTTYKGTRTIEISMEIVSGPGIIAEPKTSTIVINDDDPNNPTTSLFSFSTSSYRVNEYERKLTVTITREGYDQATGVFMRTVPGTAREYSDFSPIPGPSPTPTPSLPPLEYVSFKKGVTSRTVDIAIYNDKKVEGDETFKITLSTGENGRPFLLKATALGTCPFAQVTIVDDDKPVVQVLNGLGSGLHTPGSIVSIQAVKTDGFLRWEGADFANALSPMTTFVMPDEETQVRAIYEDAKFGTVNTNGTLSSNGFIQFVNKVKAGEKVSIKFGVVEANHARLVVFDTLGREIVTLADSDYPANTPITVDWYGTDGSGRTLGADVYILRLKIGDAYYKQMVALH